MGRTIPAFRIIALTEKRDVIYVHNLDKSKQKIFKYMFSIVYLFKSESSCDTNLIRINLIMFLLALYNNKKILLLKKNLNEIFFNCYCYLLER